VLRHRVVQVKSAEDKRKILIDYRTGDITRPSGHREGLSNAEDL
jgi:hypothetical protein